MLVSVILKFAISTGVFQAMCMASSFILSTVVVAIVSVVVARVGIDETTVFEKKCNWLSG
jgi:hypothetical protein